MRGDVFITESYKVGVDGIMDCKTLSYFEEFEMCCIHRDAKSINKLVLVHKQESASLSNLVRTLSDNEVYLQSY